MNLTGPQLVDLKAWIVANRGSAFDAATVAALNAPADPAYHVFRSTVDLFGVMANGYDWTVVDNETVGQARIWDRMLALSRQVGGVAPWKVTILQGVGEAYKGATGPVVAHRRNILRVHFPRPCTVFERLYVAAAPDWNVGSNADKTGARGLATNPDVLPVDADGVYLGAGPVTLATVEASEGA